MSTGANRSAAFLTLPSEVFARPGLAEKVTATAPAAGDVRMPGPGRAELLEIISSAGAPAKTA